jgi:hypothetical protein
LPGFFARASLRDPVVDPVEDSAMCRSKPEELRAIQSEAEWLVLRAQDVGEPFVAHLLGMAVVELAELASSDWSDTLRADGPNREQSRHLDC